MNCLFVLGNGFDRAHNLPTKYWDFRTFLEETHPEFLMEFEPLYNLYPLDPTEYGYSEAAQKRWNDAADEELWKNIEARIAAPNIDEMIGFSESVLSGIDVEPADNGIKDTMDAYWENQYGFIAHLQRYVKEWVEQIDLTAVAPKKRLLIENDEDIFLNFNYTKTLEDVYCVEQVTHIHGSIGTNAPYDPIIGHCDKESIKKWRHAAHESLEQFFEGESSIYSAIADYLERTYKDTSFLIWLNSRFFERLNNINHVVVIGWSMGEVDIPYLKKIRDSIRKDAEWTVCYYNEDSRTTLEKVLIDNQISRYNLVQTDLYWDMA